MILFWHIYLCLLLMVINGYDGSDGSNNVPCLTITKHADTLDINCSVAMLDSEVTFLDPMYKKVAFCTPPSNTSSCKTKLQAAKIFQDQAKNTTVFRLSTLNFISVDGTWTCIHGNDMAEMFIKLSEEFIYYATLKLSADLIEIGHGHQKKFSVIAKCETCWTPVGNTAVFYINSMSKDEVKRLRDKCYHTGEECRADTCGCSVLRHEYTCKLDIETLIKGTNISCSMRFEDKNNHFIKEALLQYDGKGFTNHRVKTDIKRKGTVEMIVTTNVKDTSDITQLDVSTVILIVSIVIGIIGFFVVAFICCKKHNQCRPEFKKVPSDEKQNHSPKYSCEIEEEICVDKMHEGNVTSSNKIDDTNDSHEIEEEISVGEIHEENVTSSNMIDDTNDLNELKVEDKRPEENLDDKTVTSSSKMVGTKDLGDDCFRCDIDFGDDSVRCFHYSIGSDEHIDSRHCGSSLMCSNSTSASSVSQQSFMFKSASHAVCESGFVSSCSLSSSSSNISNLTEPHLPSSIEGHEHRQQRASKPASRGSPDPQDNRKNTPKENYLEDAPIVRRRATYENWQPNSGFRRQHNMSEVIFFYSSLQNWTSDNSPSVENARGLRNLQYPQQRTGQQFIDSALTDTETEQHAASASSETTMQTTSGSDVQDPIEHAAAQYIIKKQLFGKNKERLVMKIMNQLLQNHDWEDITKEMLMKAWLESKYIIETKTDPKYLFRSVIYNNVSSSKTEQKNTTEAEDIKGFNDFGDCVRSLRCGRGLQNWEHARWSRNRPYLLQRKGQQFIDSVLTDAKIEQQTASVSFETTTEATSGSDVWHPIEHPAAQYILSEQIFGENKERLVEQTMNQLLQSYNWVDITNDRLVKALLETQTDQTDLSESTKSNNMSSSKTEQKNTTESEYIRGSNEEDPGKTQKEKEDWKYLYTCKICLVEKVGMTFVPCGHLVTCKNCAATIRRCPICCTFIRGTIKTTI